jgi:TonB family protein
MRVSALLLVIAFVAPIYAQTAVTPSPRQLVTFVAPAYPRLARDGLMTGTTVTRLKIGKNGQVIDAEVVSGHPFFTKYVLPALKQWRFQPSEQEFVLDVICRFELYSDGKCFRDNGEPITSETIVSAELPTNILVRTTARCVMVTTSDPVERK